MSHAATLVTAPDLQALFDQDWSSGKYRRPKCSKSDFYAGWLVAYERFNAVATVDKLAVVEAPAAATAPAVEVKSNHWTPELSREWLEGVTFFEPKRELGHRRITVGFKTNVWRLSEYESGEWTIERKNPNEKRSYLAWDALKDFKALSLRVARIVAAREIKGAPMPDKTVTTYSGNLPLKREPNRGLAPNDSDHGQAIPDAMLRKLAAAAGRPSIAP